MLRKILPLCAAAALVAFAPGCEYVAPVAPRAAVATVQPSGHPAKPPGCNMPVLRSNPNRSFREVALIDAVGSVYDTEKDVMPLVKSKACAAGADAVVIHRSREQRGGYSDGYYINAAAIIYTHKSFDAATVGAAPPSSGNR